MKAIKNMTLPLFAVINIVTIVISVTATYFTSNAAQDSNISNNAIKIGLVKKDVVINSQNITDLNAHLKEIEVKTDPVKTALMQQSLVNLNKAVDDIKTDQKDFIKQQNIFYQKIAAKLGIIFDN